ncbi:hypothetical protein [Nocardia gipuzkoensis]
MVGPDERVPPRATPHAALSALHDPMESAREVALGHATDFLHLSIFSELGLAGSLVSGFSETPRKSTYRLALNSM